MKFIAHRGNLNGPEPDKENSITQIKKCIDLGFDVEIDLRVINEELWLGHDQPNVKVSPEFIHEIKDLLWIHCKNIKALEFFKREQNIYNYFWHEKDAYTLTSQLFIWSYPGQKLSSKCILVMPEWKIDLKQISSLKLKNIAGICTDYPIKLL